MKEYELLKEEIAKNYETVSHYETVLYTVIVAVLAFAIQANQFLLCLIPYTAIIPVFYIAMGTDRNVCKIATYMMTFLEGSDFNWEKRHKNYDDMLGYTSSILEWGRHSQYYLLSIVCSSLAIFMLITNNNYDLIFKVCVSGIIALCTIIMLHVIHKNIFSFQDGKVKMLTNWEKIKNAETATDIKGNTLAISSMEDINQNVLKSLMELVILVLENSKTTEEAIDMIRDLSIMKSSDRE